MEATVLVLSARAPKPTTVASGGASAAMDAAHAVMNMFTCVAQSLLHEFNVHAQVGFTNYCLPDFVRMNFLADGSSACR